MRTLETTLIDPHRRTTADETTAGPTDEIVWRPARPVRAAAAVIALATVGLAAGATAASAGPVVAALLWVWALLVCGYVWRAVLVPRLVARRDALVVRNPLGRERIAYRDVTAARADWNGVTLQRRDGSRLVARAVWKSSAATWRHRHVAADDVVGDIRARAGLAG